MENDPTHGLLDRVRRALEQRAATLDAAGDDAADLESRAHAAFELADYDALPRLVGALGDDLERVGARRTLYRWGVLIEDFEHLARRVDSRLNDPSTPPAADDHLTAALLHLQTLDLDRAERAYSVSRDLAIEAGDDDLQARALHGLASLDVRRRRWDAALRRFADALALRPLDADLLLGVADVWIRLGRTAEAVEAAELAVRLAPCHEAAHYLLGNGYTRRTYRELEAADPEAFERAEDLVRRGAEAWSTGDFKAARRLFTDALAHCPDHGRAHNGLAKTLESQRLALSVYRRRDAARFAGAAEPKIPGLAELVLDWDRLAPRHRKRVALSAAPWGSYLPVLLDAGATLYIKPLHQRLSETPGQHLLRDQRIDYDARLWDDVRGCGGYHTVTGVEDVERTIWNGYDTVLHELTHLVHQLLPSDAARRIDALYRKRKARDAAHGDGFLSRYAGESAWEYLAEGANAWGSPRRDRWDNREIVRERLEERDPELVDLLRELIEEAPLDGPRAMAWAARGDDRLRHGEIDEALEAYARAQDLAPRDDGVAAARVFALCAAGRVDEALVLADEAFAARPESAAVVGARADALRLAGHGLDAAIVHLRAALPEVREDERHRVCLHLGGALWTLGDADGARRAYEEALAAQGDLPQALWGLAESHALAEDWQPAWRCYAQAVERRSGVVLLRVDFARDLLRAGEIGAARRELEAALLLDADDPDALAIDALRCLAEEDPGGALERSRRALASAPWSDWARLAEARAWRESGRADAARETLEPLMRRLRDDAAPRYVYRPASGRWILAHQLPAVLRRELPPNSEELSRRITRRAGESRAAKR